MPRAPAGATPRLACPRRAAFAAPVTRRLLLPSLAVLLAGPFAAPAAEPAAPVFTSEEPSYYDGRTREAVGVGNAQLAYGDLLLTADEIRYRTDTRIVVARGHATFTQGARRLLAELLDQLQQRSVRMRVVAVVEDHLEGEFVEDVGAAWHLEVGRVEGAQALADVLDLHAHGEGHHGSEHGVLHVVKSLALEGRGDEVRPEQR